MKILFECKKDNTFIIDIIDIYLVIENINFLKKNSIKNFIIVIIISIKGRGYARDEPILDNQVSVNTDNT